MLEFHANMRYAIPFLVQQQTSMDYIHTNRMSTVRCFKLGTIRSRFSTFRMEYISIKDMETTVSFCYTRASDLSVSIRSCVGMRLLSENAWARASCLALLRTREQRRTLCFYLSFLSFYSAALMRSRKVITWPPNVVKQGFIYILRPVYFYVMSID